MGHVVAAAAPRDVTVVHAVDDPPFPIAGARAVVAEAARSYAAVGAGERVRLVELSGGHGLHPAMRVGGGECARALRSDCRRRRRRRRCRCSTHAWRRHARRRASGAPQSTARPAERLPG